MMIKILGLTLSLLLLPNCRATNDSTVKGIESEAVEGVPPGKKFSMNVEFSDSLRDTLKLYGWVEGSNCMQIYDEIGPNGSKSRKVLQIVRGECVSEVTENPVAEFTLSDFHSRWSGKVVVNYSLDRRSDGQPEEMLLQFEAQTQ